MQNDKLNCPFCNCGAIYEITEREDIVDIVPALFCNCCKMIFKVENDSPYLNENETFRYLKEKLHKKFNTRKPMERIVEQLENHKNCYEKVIGQVIVDNYDINLERVDLMNHAIDIVRKGGVDNG